ncbi:MAG: hypothetical protein IKJ42_02315 [Bacteroidaceae bacterium]|nr:hypothetical protein [Bacteroidaceae bacterium]
MFRLFVLPNKVSGQTQAQVFCNRIGLEILPGTGWRFLAELRTNLGSAERMNTFAVKKRIHTVAEGSKEKKCSESGTDTELQINRKTFPMGIPLSPRSAGERLMEFMVPTSARPVPTPIP